MTDEKELPEEIEEEEEEWEEEINLHDEITSAAYALEAIAEIDEAILSNQKKRMIKAIRRKSLDIIYRNICDIHADVFGRNNEEENDDEDD